MTELKRCPFCGGEASIYHGDSTDGYIKGTDYVLAFCGWCGASIREKKEDDVIKKWNTRPNHWHTGTPIEEGWYLCKVISSLEDDEGKFIPYFILAYKDNEFRTKITDFVVPKEHIIKWQKIEEN